MNQRDQVTLCLGIVWVIASVVIIFIACITGAFPIKGWVSPEITKNRDFNYNCFVDEVSYNDESEADFCNWAMEFYEKTGVQAYYLKLDISKKSDIDKTLDAKNYAIDRAKQITANDNCAVVIYSTNRGNNGSRMFYINSELYYVGDAEKFFDSALRMKAKSSLRHRSTEYTVLRDILVYTGYNKSIAEATIHWTLGLMFIPVILIGEPLLEWRLAVGKVKKKKKLERSNQDGKD